ncbi:MAG: hypothetical protein F6K42_36585 [Leptolyngbya sp. SIO1D8]|nr:hypothetical protein [Leptolyngbya sp. SIO1D8]
MTTTIVNLTRQSVNRKIEEVLAQQTADADAQVLKNPDFRNQLTAYVLSRVNNCYVSVEQGQEDMLSDLSPSTPAQCQQLECVIQQGIDMLLDAPDGWMQEQHLFSAMKTPLMAVEPSHWFG